MREVGLCAIPCVSCSLRVVIPREQDVSEHLDVAAISKNYFTHVHRAVSLDLVWCSGLPGALDVHLLARRTVYSAVFLPAARGLAAVLGLHPALCWGTRLTPLFSTELCSFPGVIYLVCSGTRGPLGRAVPAGGRWDAAGPRRVPAAPVARPRRQRAAGARRLRCAPPVPGSELRRNPHD